MNFTLSDLRHRCFSSPAALGLSVHIRRAVAALAVGAGLVAGPAGVALINVSAVGAGGGRAYGGAPGATPDAAAITLKKIAS